VFGWLPFRSLGFALLFAGETAADLLDQFILGDRSRPRFEGEFLNLQWVEFDRRVGQGVEVLECVQLEGLERRTFGGEQGL